MVNSPAPTGKSFGRANVALRVSPDLQIVLTWKCFLPRVKSNLTSTGSEAEAIKTEIWLS